MKTAEPYGTWKSPISAEKASSAAVSFQDLQRDQGNTYWTEMRPLERGRCVILKANAQGKVEEMLSAPWNARTRVHEYGGGAFTVYQGKIYFTNFEDQRLYELTSQGPQAITPSGIRFAECKVTPYGIIAIAESHLENEEPTNFLALIDLTTGEINTLASGYDFYASPAISHDFKQIAWICWDHPNMPWDNTQLWVADLNENGLTNQRQINAEITEQAFFQPQWGPQGELVVASDQTNWWNLYQVKGQQLELLFYIESEIGQPLWNLGASTWAFFQDGIVCTFFFQEKNYLFFFKAGELKRIDLPYHQFSQIRAQGDKISCIAGSPDQPSAIIEVDAEGHYKILRENMILDISAQDLSQPEHITFPSEGGRLAHAFYYPPCNANYRGLAQTKPPLIVKSHGGPTGNCGSNLNLDLQYFTSRGFAVVDVNYAGSAGYGRKYRQSLEGNWGIYDVQDCAQAALYLAQKGWVDEGKLAITGGSAGGYTTLCALTFTSTFQVGSSLYGVSDLEALVLETHKFESRYLERLIGPYPQAKPLYYERSPLYHADQITAPIIFFQGTEDKVVPPSQTEQMFEALKRNGVKAEYFLFPGEQHGFRQAAHRAQVLTEQERFFVEVLK